jgi:hypothetical protein
MTVRGYFKDAVPTDYCAVPPTSMANVKHNLDLLKQVLDKKNTRYSPDQLIESLKKKVYPEIDRFLIDSKAVLSAEVSSLYPSHSLDYAFKTKKSNSFPFYVAGD